MTAGHQLRRIASGAYRRIDPNSTWGLGWKRQGEFVTFEWGGFVEAPSISMLFARHHYETTIIRRLLADKGVKRSLELGCGFGRLTPTFASLSQEHLAIDINTEALGAASSAYPQLHFQYYDGGALPFDDGAFDLVASWTVVQHIRPTMIDATLRELLRVLAPRGRALLCEETREPGAPTRHSWHRAPSFYEDHLRPLRLTYSSYIEEIDKLPGCVSPGRVMLFEP
jgi:ubiquinone/menaquinone biosynthesis C-methylase UbiE